MVTGGGGDDPVRARRARLLALATTGQRVGYSLFGLAMATFFIGAIRGFSPPIVAVVVAAMAVGSVALAPAIVLGYAARAAEREDRDEGR